MIRNSRILFFIFLQIQYSHTDELLLCEGDQGNIICASGAVAISFILYGRLNTETCPHKFTEDTNCQSSTAYSIVMAECQGLTSCVLSAKNNIYDDPCKGTFKYLQVLYTCEVPTTTTTSTTTTSTTTSAPTSAITTTTTTTSLSTTTSLGALTNATVITTQFGQTATIITQLTTVTSAYEASTTKYPATTDASVHFGIIKNGSQTIKIYDGCSCTCVDIDLDLSDPVVLNTVVSTLIKSLLIDKKTLSRHKRSLTSVYEEKESGKIISTTSFSFIILLVLLVVLADVHRFLTERCKCHMTGKERYDSLKKESKTRTPKYIYYN